MDEEMNVHGKNTLDTMFTKKKEGRESLIEQDYHDSKEAEQIEKDLTNNKHNEHSILINNSSFESIHDDQFSPGKKCEESH
jgi:short-subunit dehydrogenase